MRVIYPPAVQLCQSQTATSLSGNPRDTQIIEATGTDLPRLAVGGACMLPLLRRPTQPLCLVGSVSFHC